MRFFIVSILVLSSKVVSFLWTGLKKQDHFSEQLLRFEYKISLK